MKKKYKICVVGAGRWGLNHIRTLNDMSFLGGVVDSNHTILSDLKLKYPLCPLFPSLEKSFELNFDAYIVSTPSKSHFNIAKEIIKKGKPVLVEKPLTLNLSDAIKLNNFAKRKNVNLMVGHLLLFHPAFKKIKELLKDNFLGDIQYIYSNRLNLGRFRNDENVLWSFAPHDIALFNYFFNENPISVHSSGVDILQKGIHDTSITSFKYSNNKMGHIFVSWLHPFKEHRFVIIGSEGMIHFEDAGHNKPLIYYDKKVSLEGNIPESKLGKTRTIEYKNELPLRAELEYFISKIDSGIIKIADGDSAVNCMEILERATQSLMVKEK